MTRLCTFNLVPYDTPVYIDASWHAFVHWCLQEPIREAHASTNNCPPRKEVINSPWHQLARDQEAWVGGDTWHQSAALSKGQGVMQGSISYRMRCPEINKNSNHMLTPLFSIYYTNSKWWISSCTLISKLFTICLKTTISWFSVFCTRASVFDNVINEKIKI